jgi:DNA polymerase-1
MSSKQQKRLFIIDGYATLYRSHYALIRNPLTNIAGTPTSAIFGFANQVFQLIEDEKPDYLVAAFDSQTIRQIDLQCPMRYKHNFHIYGNF